MKQLGNSPIRIQFGLRGWAAIALGLAILAGVAFLAIGFLIFLLPILILSSILYWLLPKQRLYRVGTPAEKEARNGTTIIDGEFRVIEASTTKEPGARKEQHGG
jgi:hypothetical protein